MIQDVMQTKSTITFFQSKQSAIKSLDQKIQKLFELFSSFKTIAPGVNGSFNSEGKFQVTLGGAGAALSKINIFSKMLTTSPNEIVLGLKETEKKVMEQLNAIESSIGNRQINPTEAMNKLETIREEIRLGTQGLKQLAANYSTNNDVQNSVNQTVAHFSDKINSIYILAAKELSSHIQNEIQGLSSLADKRSFNTNHAMIVALLDKRLTSMLQDLDKTLMILRDIPQTEEVKKVFKTLYSKKDDLKMLFAKQTDLDTLVKANKAEFVFFDAHEGQTIKLKCSDGEFIIPAVHRNLLAMQNDYFSGLFTGGFAESRATEIKLPSYSRSEMYIIIDLLYQRLSLDQQVVNKMSMEELASLFKQLDYIIAPVPMEQMEILCYAVHRQLRNLGDKDSILEKLEELTATLHRSEKNEGFLEFIESEYSRIFSNLTAEEIPTYLPYILEKLKLLMIREFPAKDFPKASASITLPILKMINEANIPTLKKLNLKDSKLQSSDYNILSGWPLIELDVSSTELDRLNPSFIQGMPKLQILEAANRNFDEYIVCPSLTSLNIQNSKVNPYKLFQSLKNMPALTSLNVKNVQDNSKYYKAVIISKDLCEAIKLLNLKYLNIEDIFHDEKLIDTLKNMKSLIALSIGPFNFEESDLLQIIQNTKNLEELNIIGTKVTSKFGIDLSHLPLKKLSLINNKFITSGGDLNQIVTLTKLNLSNTSFVDFLFDESHRYKNLTELNLSGCTKMDVIALSQINVMTKIEILDLSKTSVTNEALSLIENIISIKQLNLSECPNLNGSALKHLSKFTNLERLDLSKNSFIAENSFEPIEHLNIRELNLEGCKLNSKDLRSLLKMPELEVVNLNEDSTDVKSTKKT